MLLSHLIYIKRIRARIARHHSDGETDRKRNGRKTIKITSSKWGNYGTFTAHNIFYGLLDAIGKKSGKSDPILHLASMHTMPRFHTGIILNDTYMRHRQVRLRSMKWLASKGTHCSSMSSHMPSNQDRPLYKRLSV